MSLRICAVYTESHQKLLRDWFLKSIPVDCSPRLVRLNLESSSFRSGAWHRIMAAKIILILEMLENSHSEPIVSSDVDVQFFRPIKEELLTLCKGSDILFQNSRPQEAPAIHNLCAGFCVVRPGRPALRFFQEALRRIVDRDDPSYTDQIAYQELCAEGSSAVVGILPSAYWTCGEIWFPGTPLSPPDNIAIHHAAWVVGNDGKEVQLREVRRIVGQRE